MTLKLSSCYRKNSLSAAVLTQQRPLLNGVAHSQTQAGNTNANPPRRARSKVHVALEMLEPSLASVLHKRRQDSAWQARKGPETSPSCEGPRDCDCLLARSLAKCAVVVEEGAWVGWMEPRDPVGSFSLCLWFIYMFSFLGSCRFNFCSDSSGLNLVQMLSSLATCKSYAVQLTVNAHEESTAAMMLAPGHRSSPSHSISIAAFLKALCCGGCAWRDVLEYVGCTLGLKGTVAQHQGIKTVTTVVATTHFMEASLLTFPSASKNFKEFSDWSTVSVAGSGHCSYSPLSH